MSKEAGSEHRENREDLEQHDRLSAGCKREGAAWVCCRRVQMTVGGSWSTPPLMARAIPARYAAPEGAVGKVSFFFFFFFEKG